MARKIQIDISTSGKVRVEAFGYQGKACEKATKSFEDRLGEVAEQKKKDEYWLTEYEAASAATDTDSETNKMDPA